VAELAAREAFGLSARTLTPLPEVGLAEISSTSKMSVAFGAIPPTTRSP
jgi:hypothetical protein